MAENDVVTRVSAAPLRPSRPTITLPPRAAIENLFTSFAGFSPGPMTLVSSFFAENTPDSGFRSFSQLLAGAMASPAAAEISKGGAPSSVLNNSDETSSTTDGGEKNFGGNFVFPHSPLFTVPPGLSPSGLLSSPGLFSPGQSPFGMSHQQALAQVTAQAALSQSRMHIQAGYQQSSLTASAESVTNHPSFTTSATTHQQMPLLRCDPKSSTTESSEICHPEEKPLPTSIALDKPADDGYNWRKYGQKQVKGSEYPRSYYKCTHPNCPVKKKVERSLEGRITEIIYKGQHNHEMPQPNKRAKDVSGLNGNNNSQTKPKFGALVSTGNLNMSNVTVPAQPAPGKDQETSQATSVLSVESSDSEDVGDAETKEENCNDNGEPNPKRRNTEVGVSEPAPLHKTVAEPRIIVQTRSEVDLLDDGYKWRKYGQKVVKGNPNPRSYYKCTSAGCKVRKHVERASTDAKAVITTYEGKHSHDVPAGRNNSHNTANSNALALQIKPHKVVAEKHASIAKIDFENKEQRRVSVLQLKEEQVKV